MGEPLCDDEVEEDTDAEGVIVPDTVSVGEAESDALTQLDAEELGDTVSEDVKLEVMVEVDDSQKLPEELSVPVSDGVILDESDGDKDALGDSVTVPELHADGEGEDDTDRVGEIVGEQLPLLPIDDVKETLGDIEIVVVDE